MHSDSAREFRRKQQRWRRRGGLKTQAGKPQRSFQVTTDIVGNKRSGTQAAVAAGFPEGSWGPYRPFFHPATGEPFHSSDIFDAGGLGYAFDQLP